MISINPLTYVIYVPKVDLTLIQPSPEVRELDVNNFRLWLKDYEDDPDYGIYLYKTHTHNTEVTLSGLTYARIVEILYPYTVEFEDGQYTINCIGANHNIADVKVANQVSLIVNNAAGLINNAQIEYASFNGGVTVDISNGSSGTLFPIGTPQLPVNNFVDALLIASVRGLTRLYINGNATMTGSNDFNNFEIIGQSPNRSFITIDSITNTSGCEIQNATVTGTLDGENFISDSMVVDLTYVNGSILNCGLIGDIELAGGQNAIINDCYTVDQDDPPIINMGDSGQSLAMPNYSGLITIENLSDSNQEVGIGLNAGMVTLSPTVSAGTIVISGIGVLNDNSTGISIVNSDGLLSKETVSHAVWSEHTSEHTIKGTFGGEIATKSDIRSSVITNQSTAVSGAVIYGTEASGTYSSASVRDNTYWEIDESVSDGITVEMIFNLPGTEYRPGNFSVFGRYNGQPTATHHIDLWARNYESGTWELLYEEFLPGGNTSDALYSHEYYERHINRNNNNEVKVRLIHHVTTYNASHDLFIDYMEVSSINIITAADIADAVWDETLSEHVSAGSTGYALDNMSGGSSPSVIADAVWDEQSSGHTASGSFGDILNTSSADLKRILGLMHENIYIDQPSYDSDNNLTSARVRIYSVAGSVGTTNDVIGTYTITAPSTAPGKFTTWSQIKV